MKKKIELLSPAKDLECGIAAINCGADAVYIGAARFGARKAAGNSIADIEKLIAYAHKYRAKVYVTVNTILFDNEFPEAEKLIHQLYGIGTDALIIQDMGLLELDLPPIPIFASTQTHNYNIETIKFLEGIGITRVILARELSLEQIRNISANINIELESFIHGALCVCFSGQCYLSYAVSGRSANRGECSQPCRHSYSLLDADGNTIIKDKHLLSLRDLNLSAHIGDLINAGISSFKIEGRLKDINYVKNITAWYRQRIDSVINGNQKLAKASGGKVYFGFTPDPAKSFNRGFTEYFYSGKADKISSPDTPKSIGEYVGTNSLINKKGFGITTDKYLVNGDGICYFDAAGTLCGMNINNIENNFVYTDQPPDALPGTKVFRNYDHTFNKQLLADKTVRKIGIRFIVEGQKDAIHIRLQDEDGISVSLTEMYPANTGSVTNSEIIKRQLSKTGNTIFETEEVLISSPVESHLSASFLNDLRRRLLDILELQRLQQYARLEAAVTKNSVQYPHTTLDYRGNVVNGYSRAFYKRHGVETIQDGFELQKSATGRIVMTTKYCIKKELDMCPFEKKHSVLFKDPLYLKDTKRKYELIFDCAKCGMNLKLI